MISAAPAAAQVPMEADTKIAAGVSAVDVLITEEAIRQKWADYSLFIDGDGVASGERRTQWARQMFTEDLKWRWYDAEGKLQMAVNSREEEDKGPLVERLQAASKHLPISIRFDEIGPSTVKTRTVLAFINEPTAKTPAQADGVAAAVAPGVPQVGMIVYHDTWRKVGGEWKKAVTILHSANYGFMPAGFRPSKSCPAATSKAPGCAP